MNRLTGFEEGYPLRFNTTRKLMDSKSAMIDFMRTMDNQHYTLIDEERLLLARVDAAIDDVLNVYHRIVLTLDSQ